MINIQYLANKKSFWAAIVVISLGFWISTSLFLDLMIIPTLYITGMMRENFSAAGYILFGIFNRLELIFASVILSSLMVLGTTHAYQKYRKTIVAGSVLLGITLLYTYILTPVMGSIGMDLNLFTNSVTITSEMQTMHLLYWLLEIVKITLGGTILNLVYREFKTMDLNY
jgi:hypothetical protein